MTPGSGLAPTSPSTARKVNDSSRSHAASEVRGTRSHGLTGSSLGVLGVFFRAMSPVSTTWRSCRNFNGADSAGPCCATVREAARAAGATRAVLNATPEGERLYSVEGFVHVGRGITYWNHLTGTSK